MDALLLQGMYPSKERKIVAKNESLSGLRLGFHPTCPNRSVIAMVNACTAFATKELRRRRMEKIASAESKRIKKEKQAEWKREKAEMRSRSALQRARKRVEESCRGTEKSSFDEEQYERDLDNHHEAIIKAVNKKALAMVRKSAQSPRKKKKEKKTTMRPTSKRRLQGRSRGLRRGSPSPSPRSPANRIKARSRSPRRSRTPRQELRSSNGSAIARQGHQVPELQTSDQNPEERETPPKGQRGNGGDGADFEASCEELQSPSSPSQFEGGGKGSRYVIMPTVFANPPPI